MLKLPFVIRIDFPALDRFMDWVDAREQGQVDAITEALKGVRETLKQSTTELQISVSKQQ